MSSRWVRRTRARVVSAVGTAPFASLLRLFDRYPPAPRPDPGVTRRVEAYAAPDGRFRREGEWWVPAGAAAAGLPLPTVVLVHGGFWKPGYDRHLMDAVAADLANRGTLVWNLDYRPSTAPWPATLADVAAGYDHLLVGSCAPLVDRSRIAVVGHSAGGHLALWLAARHRLPPGTSAVLTPAAGVPRPALAVSQAGVADLTRAATDLLGDGASRDLVGGSPHQVPDRYAVADPTLLLPTGIRTVLVHGLSDDTVPAAQSEGYAAAATAAGDDATVALVDGGHMGHLDPDSPAAARLRDAVAGMPATPAPGVPNP